MDWVLSILCDRKSKALVRRQPLPVGRPVIQKRCDPEGNVSLPTLGLVAARCTEGFGGITYCLADSNFGVSHRSVSQVKTACIQRSTYIFGRRALRFMLITFLYHVILIILQSDCRCQHSGRAHKVCVIHQTCFHQLRAPSKYARTAKH